MDQETLSNHLKCLGKSDLNVLVKLLLREYWHRTGINVDGANDGGADFVEYDNEGQKTPVVYQLTTQKKQVDDKIYRDAKKALDKLGIRTFYFITTVNFSQVRIKELEDEISDELDVRTHIFTPDLLAGILDSENLVPMFLADTHACEIVDINKNSVDYQNMTLYGYTFISKDARNLKSCIYDDAIIMVLAESQESIEKAELVEKTIKLLSIGNSKDNVINRRIDSLMAKGFMEKDKIKSSEDVFFVQLKEEKRKEIEARKILYSLQVNEFSALYADLMREYGKIWNKEDSKKASVWIASAYISRRLSVLQKVDAALSESFVRIFSENGISKLRSHLLRVKNISPDKLDEIEDKMLAIAANHPLIEKLTRAAVYIALEGTNPLSASKVLGAYRWNDVYLMIEPTVGIPLLCSYLYEGNVNRWFNNAIDAANRAKSLGVHLCIPYLYIDECAGHLLLARRFDGLDLQPDEMQFSRNAFVANYYRLKLAGVEMPNSFMDYLATFSPAIKTEHSDIKNWKREIVTSLQSYFTQHGVIFEEIPMYNDNTIENEILIYSNYLDTKNKQKSYHLIKNDVLVMHHIKERVVQEGEHWMLLTNDHTLIAASDLLNCTTWVATPSDFIDMTAMSAENSENRVFSVMHTVANLSDRALSVGARILDNIILYASDKMQDWQFKEKVELFKAEMLEEVCTLQDDAIFDVIDKKTESFLQEQGAPLIIDEDFPVDMENADE